MLNWKLFKRKTKKNKPLPAKRKGNYMDLKNAMDREMNYGDESGISIKREEKRGRVLYKAKMGKEEYEFSSNDPQSKYFIPVLEEFLEYKERMKMVGIQTVSGDIYVGFKERTLSIEQKKIDRLGETMENVREMKMDTDMMKKDYNSAIQEADEVLLGKKTEQPILEDPIKTYPNLNLKKREPDWKNLE